MRYQEQITITKDLYKNTDEFIEEKIEKELTADKKYNQLEESYLYLYDKIWQGTSDENKKEMEQLLALHNDILNYSQCMIYKAGYYDGIIASKLISVEFPFP